VNLAAHIISNGLNYKGNLHGQLTSGCYDESLDMLRGTINCLQTSDGKGTCFTSSRLGLGDCVVALNDWQNASLLDWGGLGKSIAINSSEDFLL
jgi:hypothetical protein